MKKEKIKELIKSIVRLFKSIKDMNNKILPQKKSIEILPESIKDVKPSIEDNEIKENNNVNFPIFDVGVPNLAKDDNTIKVRKFINYEFGLNFETDWLQCTEYVQYKVLKELRIRINWAGRVGRRDGVDWPAQFLKLGRYNELKTPKRGCAMSFASGCRVPPGHVAYVEDVLENGSIFISEANWPPPGQKTRGQYNERPLTKNDWQNKYKGRFIDFSQSKETRAKE